MDSNQKTLIELVLFKAIRTFHECSNKEERENSIKEYTLNFCKEYNINPIEAIDLLNELFKTQREKTEFKFEHYENDALKTIVLPTQGKTISTKSSSDVEIGD